MAYQNVKVDSTRTLTCTTCCTESLAPTVVKTRSHFFLHRTQHTVGHGRRFPCLAWDTGCAPSRCAIAVIHITHRAPAIANELDFALWLRDICFAPWYFAVIYI